MCEKFAHFCNRKKVMVAGFKFSSPGGIDSKRFFHERGGFLLKLTRFNRYGYLLVLGPALLFAGCVREPVRTGLAIDHPANFRAPETPFVRPPNPFVTDGSMAERDTETNDHMFHKNPAEAHGQTENHRMENMEKPASPQGSGAEKTLPEHKEHHH